MDVLTVASNRSQKSKMPVSNTYPVPTAMQDSCNRNMDMASGDSSERRAF